MARPTKADREKKAVVKDTKKVTETVANKNLPKRQKQNRV